jgi:hypothetical protein
VKAQFNLSRFKQDLKMIDGVIINMKKDQQFLKSANKPLEYLLSGVNVFLRINITLLFFSFIDIWFH